VQKSKERSVGPKCREPGKGGRREAGRAGGARHCVCSLTDFPCGREAIEGF
jgi:hypothetical protein